MVTREENQIVKRFIRAVNKAVNARYNSFSSVSRQEANIALDIIGASKQALQRYDDIDYILSVCAINFEDTEDKQLRRKSLEILFGYPIDIEIAFQNLNYSVSGNERDFIQNALKVITLKYIEGKDEGNLTFDIAFDFIVSYVHPGRYEYGKLTTTQKQERTINYLTSYENNPKLQTIGYLVQELLWDSSKIERVVERYRKKMLNISDSNQTMKNLNEYLAMEAVGDYFHFFYKDGTAPSIGIMSPLTIDKEVLVNLFHGDINSVPESMKDNYGKIINQFNLYDFAIDLLASSTEYELFNTFERYLLFVYVCFKQIQQFISTDQVDKRAAIQKKLGFLSEGFRQLGDGIQNIDPDKIYQDPRKLFYQKLFYGSAMLDKQVDKLRSISSAINICDLLEITLNAEQQESVVFVIQVYQKNTEEYVNSYDNSSSEEERDNLQYTYKSNLINDLKYRVDDVQLQKILIEQASQTCQNIERARSNLQLYSKLLSLLL